MARVYKEYISNKSDSHFYMCAQDGINKTKANLLKVIDK